MAFATVEDIATRLGRELSAIEGGMGEMLLDAATAVIADAAGKNDAWAAALNPVPQMLKFLAIEVVVRAMGNPEGLASIREQLGAHSYAKNFRAVADAGGLLLTDVEERLVRRVVFGRNSGSSRPASVIDEIYGCS